MAYFLKSGNTFTVSSREALDLHEQLPAGNYVIKKNEMTGALYLEQIDGFEIKGKVYGDTVRMSNRVLDTFKDRPTSTGILLTGEKGSGKTLLAKMISYQASQQGIPTIVINAAWHGDKFNAFMQSIDQPCVVLFDEFEKVYDRDEQTAILTLLDGVFPSKKLFILTCNDKWRIDSHMRNRPGRIFYMVDYKGLDNDFIVEYCEDNLHDRTHINAICKIAAMFDQFNFDMLKALIEEMNRYGETPQQALRMLNAKPEFSDESRYEVELEIGAVPINKDFLESDLWHGNPLTGQIVVEYRVGANDLEEDDTWEHCRFETNDLKHIDPAVGKFVFVNDKGGRVTLRRVREKNFNYLAF
jgi:hypothetical protein